MTESPNLDTAAGAATAVSPRPDYSEYTLRVVKPGSAQEVELWQAQYVPWHAGRTWEAYMAATRKTRETYAAHGMFHIWALVKRSEPDGRIYSGCQTLRYKAFIRNKGEKEIRDTWVYNIKGVITAKDQLRRGFANHMLKLLHYVLADPSCLPPFPAEWGAPPPGSALDKEERQRGSADSINGSDKVIRDVPPGMASVLNSDVGAEFYGKCTVGREKVGWAMRDEANGELVWEIHDPVDGYKAGQGLTGADVKGEGDGGKKWEWLYLADLDAESTIALTLRSDFLRDMREADGSKSICAMDPTSPRFLNDLQRRCLDTRPSGWGISKEHEPVGIRISYNTEPGEADIVADSDGHNARDGSSVGESDSNVAIVLFTYSPSIIGPQVLITRISSLAPTLLPLVLEAIDEYAHMINVNTTKTMSQSNATDGNAMAIREGWVWGLEENDPLVRAWQSLGSVNDRSDSREAVREDGKLAQAKSTRAVRVGNRRESGGGHLLCVAWYGHADGGQQVAGCGPERVQSPGEQDRGICIDRSTWTWR